MRRFQYIVSTILGHTEGFNMSVFGKLGTSSSFMIAISRIVAARFPFIGILCGIMQQTRRIKKSTGFQCQRCTFESHVPSPPKSPE